MRRYDQLNGEEKIKAIEHFYRSIFEAIVCDDIVPDFLEPFEGIISSAKEKAEMLSTPWFYGEMLNEQVENNSEFRKAIVDKATVFAEKAYYASENEIVVRL